MDLEGFESYLLGEGYAPSTIRRYRNLLRGVFVEYGFDIDSVQDLEIARFLYELPRREEAKNNLAKAINAYLKFRGRNYRLKLKKMRGERHRWIPTPEEKERLLNVVWDSAYITERNQLLLRILFEAGLRADEVRKISYSDVIVKYRYTKKGKDHMHFIQVVGKGRKGKKVRMVPISQDLYQRMLYYKRHYGSKRSNFIFDNGRGHPITTKTVRRICYEAGKKAGVSRFHPHAARHYRAVELLQEGVSLETIRRFLGHSSLETTQIYLEGLQQDEYFEDLRSKDKYFKKSQEVEV